jgi:hypothetical protein
MFILVYIFINVVIMVLDLTWGIIWKHFKNIF